MASCRALYYVALNCGRSSWWPILSWFIRNRTSLRRYFWNKIFMPDKTHNYCHRLYKWWKNYPFFLYCLFDSFLNRYFLPLKKKTKSSLIKTTHWGDHKFIWQIPTVWSGLCAIMMTTFFCCFIRMKIEV